MAYAIFEEACQNYDIDGIHLDFFRHPCFFKDAAEGKVLPQETLDLMTDMVRKIREMTEIEGMKRGRPILVSIRVPDSVEFCRAIGLDIEKWMEEDLVDILCTSSYTQLNYWEYSVELGHKYGVRVYPSVDETRVRDDNANATRMSLESYAARLTNVWNSGADGFLLFNYYGYNSPIFKVGDDTEKLLNYNKHYFASYRGVGYFSRTWPHREFINIPTVNPYDKMELKKGQPVTVVFPIGEDLEKAIEKGKHPPSIYGFPCPKQSKGQNCCRAQRQGYGKAFECSEHLILPSRAQQHCKGHEHAKAHDSSGRRRFGLHNGYRGGYLLLTKRIRKILTKKRQLTE